MAEAETKDEGMINVIGKNTEQGSIEALFVYIFHRLAQAENKCKLDWESIRSSPRDGSSTSN